MPSDQVPQVTLKTEMNSSYKRLPTFRAPRDLKLSQFRDIPSSNALGEGRPKKVFVPNLNVHRKKNDDENRTRDADSGDSAKTVRTRGTDLRGRGTDSRGRGRKPREYIQQSGVFSQGLAPSLKATSWGSKSSSDSSPSTPAKPRLKLNEDLKVNKEEEEEVMKQLLRDDFIDDPEIQADMDNAPVELPLQDCCKWEHIKDEKPFIIPIESSECSSTSESIVNGIKVKPDPELLELSNGIADSTSTDRKPVNVHAMRSLSLNQLMSTSAETNFLFFQIPHRVPKLKMNVNPLPGGQKRTGEKSNDEEDNEACVLRSLPQGRIGTLQIRKSGRAALVLGDVRLNVEPGTQSAFKQNLVSVNLENSTKSGNMIDMGRIAARILVTPDWKHLLNQSK